MKQNYDELPNKNFGEKPLAIQTQFAIWICLSTLCRIGELELAEWKHINFEERTWFIPAENTKGQRGKKHSQLVYLSDFTFSIFKKLHALTGHYSWVFPSKDGNNSISHASFSKQIGDRQIKFKSRKKKLQKRVENDSLVLGDQEWTPHDLRRTGATMMQKLKIGRDIINLCQNHVIGSTVDKSYLLDDYADDKREAWYKLGDYLQKLLS